MQNKAYFNILLNELWKLMKISYEKLSNHFWNIVMKFLCIKKIKIFIIGNFIIIQINFYFYLNFIINIFL